MQAAPGDGGGQGSRVGCSPRGRKELDMPERRAATTTCLGKEGFSVLSHRVRRLEEPQEELLFPPWSCPREPQGPAQASTDFPWPLCPRRAAVLDRLLCLHLRLCVRMPVMGGRGGVNGNGLAGPPQESARLTRESNYDVTAVPLPRRSNWGAPRAQRFLEEKR